MTDFKAKAEIFFSCEIDQCPVFLDIVKKTGVTGDMIPHLIKLTFK